jgi:membrane-associated HD superfamily phosphohydrolase
MSSSSDSWFKVVITAFAVPLFFVLLSTLLIPKIIEKSNKTEALRTARLKKSLDVGDRNREFTSRLNVLKTSMLSFNNQNVRGNRSATELRASQKQFQETYTERYLALDEVAWWWYWDLEREVQAFDLLSPDESRQMLKLVKEYGDNVTASVAALDSLWKHLSSSSYSTSSDNQARIREMETEMNSELSRLYEKRTSLVKDISKLFAQSTYEPKASLF